MLFESSTIALQPAMDRLFSLLDAGSFTELASHAECGVAAGYGTVEGRLVYVYSQYGAVNTAHAAKLARLYAAAMQMGAPVVAFLSSPGLALEDNLRALDAYGRVFACMAEANGVVPQIAVVAGRCMGTAAYIAALSDFVVVTEADGCLLLESPAAAPAETAKTETAASQGGAKAAVAAGLAHFTAPGMQEASHLVKDLLAYLPSNNLDEAPIGMFVDDLARDGAQPPATHAEAIALLADNQRFLACGQARAAGTLTAFARVNGYSTGFIAVEGALSAAACDKAAAFARFCDAFSIPLVVLNAATGYDMEGNQAAVLQSGARLLAALSQATVPRVCLLTGPAYGSPYLLLNSHHIGADITLAWPTANLAAMPPQAAERVLNFAAPSHPEAAAEAGFIDQIITPAETRAMLVSALEMLNAKRAARHAKKHSGKL